MTSAIEFYIISKLKTIHIRVHRKSKKEQFHIISVKILEINHFNEINLNKKVFL